MTLDEFAFQIHNFPENGTNKTANTTKINEEISKYNDTILNVLDASLKLKSTFSQGNFWNEIELLFFE